MVRGESMSFGRDCRTYTGTRFLREQSEGWMSGYYRVELLVIDRMTSVEQ